MPKQESPYQKWYQRNKDKLNARRRERYARDKDYRNRHLEMARRRSKRRRDVTSPPPDMFTTEQAAHVINRGPAALREWEKRGLVPPASVYGRKHFYTAGQVQLLNRLRAVMDSYFTTDREKFRGALEEIVEYIKENW